MAAYQTVMRWRWEGVNVFRYLNRRTTTESQALVDAINIIEGEGTRKHSSDGNHSFIHLEAPADYLPVAKPRIYDGALYETIDERMYQSIGMHIVPTNDSKPIGRTEFLCGGRY